MSHNLYRKVVNVFPRRQYLPKTPFTDFQVDLADYSHEEGPARGYILVLIDTFTRKIWTQVLQNKDEASIVTALKTIMKEEGLAPETLVTDKESGLIHTKQLDDIRIMIPSTGYAFLAENAIKSLKTLIEPLRDHTPGRQWKTHVEFCTKELNNRRLRDYGVTPNEMAEDMDLQKLLMAANLEHEEAQRKEVEKIRLKFKPGDSVIIPLDRKTFHKGYRKQWDDSTVYTVDSVDTMRAPPIYVIKAPNGTLLRKYVQHLQAYNVPKKEPKPRKPAVKKEPIESDIAAGIIARRQKKY